MGHDPQHRENESARLDSWKEIASFLHRDARTVRRWERERRLPVHRVPGGERSGVFAYVAELESWLHATEPIGEIAAVETVVAIEKEVGAASLAAHASTHDVTNKDLTNKAEAIGNAHDAITPRSSLASAFHSLNTVGTTFVDEITPVAEYASSPLENFVPVLADPVDPRNGSILKVAAPRPRSYQMAALLALLSVAVGISAAVVHYRGESKPMQLVAHPPNAEAQELYLRGRYYWNLRTEEGLNSAVDLFTQSIVNDPHYAAAYAGLADAYLLQRQYGHMPNSEAFPRALAAARQAIALDDSSPEAHRSLAFVLRFWNWDMAAAEQEYRRAIALNPNDSQSHHWYATALLASGRTHEALAQIDTARTLEPQSVSVLADRGLILSLIDPPAGIVALQQVEQAEPTYVSTHRYLAGVYLQTGEHDRFLSESLNAAELSHDSAAINILSRAQKVLNARGPKSMLRELAVSWAPFADRDTFPAYNVARFYGLAGDTDGAFRYLRLACERRDPAFLGVENEPAFVSLRSSPEYTTLASRRDAALGGSRQPVAKLETPSLSQ